MNLEFEDTLEPLGIFAGVFVIVTSLGTLSGMPWTTSLNGFIGAVQVVGILASIAVGAVLISLSYTGDVGDLFSGDDGTAGGDNGTTADSGNDDATDEFGVTPERADERSTDE